MPDNVNNLLKRSPRHRVQLVGRSWPQVEKELQEFLDSLGQGITASQINEKSLQEQVDDLLADVIDIPAASDNVLAARIFSHQAVSPGIPPSGTLNHLAKFVAPNMLGDSIAIDNGSMFSYISELSGSAPSTGFYVQSNTHGSFDAGGISPAAWCITNYLAPGYTGPSPTFAGYFQNGVNGTAGVTVRDTNLGGGGFLGNVGSLGASFGNSTGTNIGVVGYGQNTGGDAIAGVFNSRFFSAVGGKGLGIYVIGSDPGHNISIGGVFTLAQNPVLLTKSACIVLDHASKFVPTLIGKHTDPGGGTPFEIIHYTFNQAGNLIFGNEGGRINPVSRFITGEPGLGVDIVGADLSIYGGISTGAAIPSKLKFKATTAIGSGGTLQTPIDAMTIGAAGAINLPQLTASKPLFTDASKNMVSGDFATAENILACQIFGS